MRETFLSRLFLLLGHERLGRSNSSHCLSGQGQPLLTEGVPFYSVIVRKP
jgi:hypothetical protein